LNNKDISIKIELKYQRISDAKRFFEILNNPNFTYFDVCPKDIEAEKLKESFRTKILKTEGEIITLV
jgi:hypothetical protein